MAIPPASEAEAAPASKKEKKDKKHKDKSSKRSESDGVRKEKKDKKKDKAAQEKLVRALDAHLQAEVAAEVEAESAAEVVKESKHHKKDKKEKKESYEGEVAPDGAMVYFALPLADEKTQKKIFKLVKKGTKLRAIHRGVKECEKAIKKAPLRPLNIETPDNVPGLLILAGDISPPEVLEHFPIHAEEHNVPYLFVRSRADLGVAACTKRATSVVLIRPEGSSKKPQRDDKKGNAAKSDVEASEADGKEASGKVDPEEFREAWRELVKIAQREYVAHMLPMIQKERATY